MQSQKSWVMVLPFVLCCACNASDTVSHYEDTDSAAGPRIDKEHQEAPPVPDTFFTPADTARDSLSRRSIVPPGETDTSALNISP